ncbi:MAG: UDP-3-O-acyl-N-acetylglucosamine deacetylase [Rhodospirillales bacterium]|nr:UDP-3-O-acyl-N-acetylglucosamine deacetylase [Rhodospirillales bacterium]MBO6787234.1 UDP-3-O-acyl-N-acetylglucosamine deacetylase [Rhodospirillales bacterium]
MTDLDQNEPVVRQRTLKSSINCTGVGLHSGEKISMTMKPAPVNTGVVFHRTDINGKGAVIPARFDRVVDTRLCSVLGNEDGVTVGTVEHVMAALAGCGIDNVEIELNGAEVPIMDGSSEPFVFLIECAGIVEQDAPRRVIRVLKRVEVSYGSGHVAISPADTQIIDIEIDFDSQVVNRQEMSLKVVNGAFRKELAKARTFGFLHEVEALWEAGLAKGGSLDNAIVVGHEGVMNEDGLRFDDEFVRHKALDAIGDLYLAGAPLIGRFEGVCSGHAANNKLVRALLADESAWEWGVLRGDAVNDAVDGGLEAERVAAAV